MFILELVLLYKVINLAVTEIGKKTVLPAAIQDYNKKTGVYECKTLVESASPREVGGKHDECLPTPFTELEPIGAILGEGVVYMTTPEIKYLSGVEEKGDWGNPDVASVMRHIKDSQLIRSILFSQPCT